MPLPQKRLIPGILLMLAIVALAAPPIWWSQGNPPVINPAAVQNNKGPVTVGQAKWMVSEALRTLDGLDPALSGAIRNKLIQPRPDPSNPGQNLPAILNLSVPADPKPQAWLDKQKAPLLVGQLKAISAPFYQELHNKYPAWLQGQLQENQTKDGSDQANFYPWSSNTGDDENNGIANIGQLKAVFSLRFESLPLNIYVPGTVTGRVTAPFIDAYDVYNLQPATGADKMWTDSPTHGQSFVTGSSPVELRSVTYRVDHRGTPATKTYKIRVGTLSGDTFTEIHSETLTQSTTWNPGEYLTWSLSTPVPLAANTPYAVDVKMLTSSNGWQQGIPYIVYSGNTYPGGKHYVTSGAQTTVSQNANRDRIFHIDLASSFSADITPPVVTSFSPTDGALDAAAAGNLVISFNEEIVPGSGIISVRNLTDATETAIDITDATQVSVSGTDLTINPTSDLVGSKDYALRIGPTAVKDLAGNNFAGINDDSTWNFKTANAVYVYSPGTVTRSAGAPFVDAYDIYNLVAATGSDKMWLDTPTHGQSFLTGASPVALRSVSYRVGSTNAPAIKAYKIRVGTLSGDTFTEIHSETLTQNTPWNPGEYMTWSFSTPVPLAANTLYAFDVEMVSSTTAWQLGIPYILYSGNTYPDGKHYVTSGTQTTVSQNANRDRIFHIDLAPSGVEMVTVPDVLGLDQAAAESSIAAANLVVGTVTTQHDATVPAGAVISQNPSGATTAATGTAVSLVVSLGVQMVTVPDVVTLDQSTAESNIIAAQLTVGTVTTAYSETIPDGNVISQTPIGGSSAAIQSSVDLVVSSIDADTDGDGLPDAFEFWIINHSLHDGISTLADVHPTGSGINGDFDGDGVDNLTEFLNGTDPTSIYSGGGVEWPRDAIIAWYRTDRDDITADGSGKVAEWNNSVSTGHLMSQADVSNRPDLVAGVLNGQDIVRFASSDRMSISPDGGDMITPEDGGFAVLGVFKMGASTGTSVSSILSNETQQTSGFRLGISNGQLKWWSDESGGNASLAYPEPVTEGESYQFALNYQGSGAQDFSELYVNGELRASAAGKTIVGNGNPITLQDIAGITAQPGDWGDLIITNRALSRGEATLVQDYLRGKLQGVGPLSGTDRSYEDLDFGVPPLSGGGSDFSEDQLPDLFKPVDTPPPTDSGSLTEYLTFWGETVEVPYSYDVFSAGSAASINRSETQVDVGIVHIEAGERSHKNVEEGMRMGQHTFPIQNYLKGVPRGETKEKIHLKQPIPYASDHFSGDKQGWVLESKSADWGIENVPDSLSRWTVIPSLFRSGRKDVETESYNYDTLYTYTNTWEDVNEVVGSSEVADKFGLGYRIDLVSDIRPGTTRMEATEFSFEKAHEYYYQLYLQPEFFGMPFENMEAQEDQISVPENQKKRFSVGTDGTIVNVELPLGSPVPNQGLPRDYASNGSIQYYVEWRFEWHSEGNENFKLKAANSKYRYPNTEDFEWSEETEDGSLSVGGYETPFAHTVAGQPLESVALKITPPPGMPVGTTGYITARPVMQIIADQNEVQEIDLTGQSGAAYLLIKYEDEPEFLNTNITLDEASGAKYRKISLVGRPVQDGKPQSDEETDEEPEETFVDALSRDLSHSTTDVYVPVPASELVLCVRRNAASETWSHYSGLLPSQRADMEFGPGWSSNLGAGIRISEQVVLVPGSDPSAYDGDLVGLLSRDVREDFKVQQSQPNVAVVTDEHGRSYQFVVGYQNAGPFPPGQTLVNQQRKFYPMPSASNQVDNYLVRLEEVNGKFIFTKQFGNILEFSAINLEQTVSSNRVYGSNQATKNSYARLEEVTDRHGEKLVYSYAGSSRLTPTKIAVAGRPNLCISILQNNEGQVTRVTDPRGNEVNYTYEQGSDDVDGTVVTGDTAEYGSATSGVLRKVMRGGFTTAIYGYDVAAEGDHLDPLAESGILDGDTELRPWGKPLTGGGGWEQYEMKTWHLDLSNITDGYNNETRFTYAFDLSRAGYSHQQIFDVIDGELKPVSVFSGNTLQSGMPRDVTEIHLPGGRSVAITGTHLLTAGPTGNITAERSTQVVDAEGNSYSYTWGEVQNHVLNEATLNYVYTESYSRTQVVGLTEMTIDFGNGGTEKFVFDPAAGYAPSEVTDFSGNVTKFEYWDDYAFSLPYGGLAAYTKFGDPSRQIKVTDWGELRQTFTYDELTRIMSGIEDELGRTTTYGIAPTTGLREWEEKKDAAGNILSRQSFLYHPTFGSFLAKSTVQDFGSLPGEPDPAWVTNLVTINEPDANGRVARSAVDMDGNGVINAGDLITEYAYDFNGNKLTSKDPSGNITYFQYDQLNRLTAVIRPNDTYQTVVTKTFAYDRRSNKVLETDERGVATAYVYDATNRLVQTVRDMNGNLAYNPETNQFTGIDSNVDIVSSIEYNKVNSPVKSTDARGFVSVTEYDYLQRPERMITPKGNTAAGVVPDAATGYVTELFYDGENAGGSAFNVSGFKPTRSLDPRGYETKVTYDDLYRPTRTLTQYADGKYAKSTALYDNVGNALENKAWRTPTDANGTALGSPEVTQTTKTDYDGLNRPVLVTKGFGSSLASTVASFYTTTGFVHRAEEQIGIDPNTGTAINRATDNTYDAAGRLIASLGPEVPDEFGTGTLRPLTQTFYNPNGTVAANKNPLGKQWDYVYDSLNRKVREFQPAVVDGVTGLSTRPVMSTAYDEVGNVIRSTDARGYVSFIQYDAANRPVNTFSPPVPVDGVISSVTTTTGYDANGNVLSVTDGNGNVTLNTYDALNRLSETKTNPIVVATAQPHAEDIVVKNEYDPAGNLLKVTDGKGQVTGFRYDGLNRKTLTIWDEGSAIPRHENTTFDALVQIERLDPKGQVTEYQYDALYRLSDVSYIGRPQDDRHYTYDLVGNLLSVTYPTETTGNQAMRGVSQSYDKLNRVVSETSNGVMHQTTYDAAGNTITQTYGQTGRKLTCVYDALNRLSTCSEATGTDLPRVTGYAYDLNGNITRKTLPNLTYTDKVYDALNRCTSIANLRANATEIHNIQTTYDAAGNVIGSVEPAADNGGVLTIENTYDLAYRLIQENRTTTGGSSTYLDNSTYTYDKANNRIGKSNVTGVEGDPNPVQRDIIYAFGNGSNGYNSNQLVSYESVSNSTDPSGNFTVGFSYDANGNRASSNRVTIWNNGEKTLQREYIYDFDNRLSQISELSGHWFTDGDGYIVTTSPLISSYYYAYDHRTRRVMINEETMEGGGQTRIVFSGGLSVQEYSDGDGLTVEYIRGSDYGGGVGGILYSLRSGDPSYNYYNSRGDVLAKTDNSGSTTWQANYEAFGTRTQENGSTQDRQKANTKDEDPTGLLNEGFRYRDLEAGVFITRDPLGFVDGPNVYTYVRQNPWTFFDPLGLQSSEPIPRADPVTGEYLPVPTSQGTFYPVNPGSTRGGHGGERQFVHGTTMATNGDNSVPAFFSPGVMASDKQVAMNESAREIVFNNFVETVAKPTGAFALENAPLTGTGTAIGEVATGKDLMGADVSRGLAAAGIVAGVIPGGKLLLKKIGGLFRKTPTSNVDNVLQQIDEIVESGGEVKINKAGDPIIMQGDKKVRIDLNNSHGDKPHFHYERQTPSGKWKDAGDEHRNYFEEE